MHFPGKAIPFGCLVYFVPAPTKDQRDKTAPRMRPGIFMGYRLPPGGLWTGDYLVVDLDDFSGLSMHTKAEPSLFKNCKPHITRTVKWTKHGINFPLFEKSILHNETIEGIEQANIQMNRERLRRRKEKMPILKPLEAKAYRAFAQFHRIKTQPAGAGFEEQPEDQVSLPDLEIRDLGEVTKDIDETLPFEDWKIEDQYDAYTLPFIEKSPDTRTK